MGRSALAAFLFLWGAATAYLWATGADAIFPVVSLLLFGGVLGGLSVWLTRPDSGPCEPIERPWRGLWPVLLYMLTYALFVLGWLFDGVRALLPAGQGQELAILSVKLLVHVALPMLLLVALGLALPAWRGTVSTKTFWRTLLVIGGLLVGLVALVSPSLRELGGTGANVPVMIAAIMASFVWNSVEAGLCEEYLFRGVLQGRLADALRSRTAAVLLTSVIFALAHAPGLYLRGGPGVDGWSTDPLQVAAFTIATLAPLSILLGVIYARTRSLTLVILLHGSIDTLPHAAEMVRIWFRPLTG